MEVFQRYGVTTLIESAVKNDKDLERAHSLLGAQHTESALYSLALRKGPQEGNDGLVPGRQSREVSQVLSNGGARRALEKRYLELTKERLPAQARENRWPLRFDHCFMRVVLDNAFQGCWYDHLDRRAGALKTISEEKLKEAVSIAEEISQDPTGQVLCTLNSRSLKWRGKGSGR